MKKKVLLAGLLLLSLVTLTGCFNKTVDKEKALEFKKDYESINGLTNKNGKAHRVVDIDEENPFVTTTAEDIVKRIIKGKIQDI